MAATARVRPQDRAGLVGAWCALWLLVGVWTGVEIWQLSTLTETVADSGRALDRAGTALESLRQVPLVGRSTGELGSDVRANAADIVSSAQSTGSSVRRLSVLLGITIVVVPTVPVVVGYRAVQRAARADG